MNHIKLQLNLTDYEIQTIYDVLKREPNLLEWKMIEAQWSEHCSYKSSKEIIQQFPTTGKNVIVGPGYDAGVIDVGDGYAVTLHIESHNHPSAIDPYGGAATGIGGVIRDILCMGTRPIALIDPLRFGYINQSPHSKWLFKNVIKGIADYGNCVGIPTVAGEVEFDKSFERNCLVDVACVGIGKINDIVLAEAKNIGDQIILVGGNTGRDGVEGVTFASKNLTDKSESDRASVQIPDPFTKKLLIEATLESIGKGVVAGLKDLGGGGLTCALSEMANKGNSGADVDISKIIIREKDMKPEEILISESQERMLFIINKTSQTSFIQILEKYDLDYSIIGTVIKTPYLKIRHKNQIIANLPINLISEAPLQPHSQSKPKYLNNIEQKPPNPTNYDIVDITMKLLSSPNIANKKWIYRQYDHEVGIRTIIKPGDADSSILKLPNNKYLAITADGNSKHCYLDPYYGSAGCVSESCRNIIAMGAKPIGIVDHCQFGDPNNEEVFWTFNQAVKGISDYCHELKLPIVGGKVSFYNEDKSTRQGIKPSPVIVTLGLANSNNKLMTQGLKNKGNYIIIIGETKPELGGSEYYEYIHNFIGGIVPKLDFKLDSIVFNLIYSLIDKKLLASIHDCSKGGFLPALLEMCIHGSLGVNINLHDIPNSVNNIHELLFSETHGRFIIEVTPSTLSSVVHIIKKTGLPFNTIGKVINNKIEIYDLNKKIIDSALNKFQKCYMNSIPNIMEQFS